MKMKLDAQASKKKREKRMIRKNHNNRLKTKTCIVHC